MVAEGSNGTPSAGSGRGSVLGLDESGPAAMVVASGVVTGVALEPLEGQTTGMSKKRVTIKDIARESGVTHTTVSRALSQNPEVSALVTEKTRERIKRLAADLGYTPNLMAKGFVTGRTGTLGLLTYQLNREIHGTYADEILKAADRRNYQILVSLDAHAHPRSPVFPTDRSRQIQQTVARGVDGLLIHTLGEGGESERILKSVEGLPVVTFVLPTSKDLSGVVLDETAGFFEVTEHLIRLGHERIGFIGSDWNRDRVGSAKARGYLGAMQEHHLTPERLPATHLVRSGYQLGKATLDRFTAYVCRTDYIAIGLCRGLREAGLRVPEDVAVVGQGDLEVSAYLSPALTTLATPYEEIAETVMDLMLELLQGSASPRPRKVTLPYRLIVRESCGST